MKTKTSRDSKEESTEIFKEPDFTGNSEITDFYEGCNIFITGGSGFMGKLLMEKYLRCCSKMGKFFVLLRPKKGKSIDERKQQLFNDPIFNLLKDKRSDFMEQVHVIEGDTQKSDLGISIENRQLLLEQTHIVIHGAANVRFDEKLRTIVETNVRAVKLLLLMAKEMKKLKAFVHISTAFSYCDRKNINEEFYAPPIKSDNILELVNLLDDDALAVLTPKIIGQFPNTYAFSKAVAEDVVKNYGTDISACIVRPSIVVSTDLEPISGWINNLYGPVGFSTGIGLGIIRTLHCKPEKTAEMIPGDYATSTIVAAAWNTGKTWNTLKADKEHQKQLTPIIYNCVSSCQQKITWDEYMNWGIIAAKQYPSVNSIWCITVFLIPYKWPNKLVQFFLHTIPAILVDSICILTGRKPRLLDIYGKIHNFDTVLSYFSTQEWNFSNDNILKMWNAMSDTDRIIYNFNVTNIDWRKYMVRHVLGLRKYMLKDSPDTLEQGHKHHQRYRRFQTAIVILFSVFVLWLTMKLLQLFV